MMRCAQVFDVITGSSVALGVQSLGLPLWVGSAPTYVSLLDPWNMSTVRPLSLVIRFPRPLSWYSVHSPVLSSNEYSTVLMHGVGLGYCSWKCPPETSVMKALPMNVVISVV